MAKESIEWGWDFTPSFIIENSAQHLDSLIRALLSSSERVIHGGWRTVRMPKEGVGVITSS
jgi:hypothetical protein